MSAQSGAVVSASESAEPQVTVARDNTGKEYNQFLVRNMPDSMQAAYVSVSVSWRTKSLVR